jgi:hypothetical protein
MLRSSSLPGSLRKEKVEPLVLRLLLLLANEVVVFWDLFSDGLHFPLDGAVSSILQNFGMYLNHLSPNAILWLSIYMWASKTMSVSPTAANFVRVHIVHHQPLKI